MQRPSPRFRSQQFFLSEICICMNISYRVLLYNHESKIPNAYIDVFLTIIFK